MKPIFIVIEGIDGTGKTTLAKNLRDRLSDKTSNMVLTQHFPTESFYLKEHLIHDSSLKPDFYTQDMYFWFQEQNQDNEAPVLWILDRSWLSTIAYAKAKNPDWERSTFGQKLLESFPEPVMWVWLHGDPEKSLKRSLGGDEAFELGVDYITRVQENYKEIFSDMSAKGLPVYAAHNTFETSFMNEVESWIVKTIPEFFDMEQS